MLPARANPGGAAGRGRSPLGVLYANSLDSAPRVPALPDRFDPSSIAGKPHADVDAWQTPMQLRPLRVGRVRIYPDGLAERDAALTGVERVTDLTAAVGDSMARHRDPRVAFVPEGPCVVPVHALRFRS